MVEILRNKNLATKFQILAEIANGGPHLQQRDIALKLEVTPQAISDYVGQLVRDGLLNVDRHAKYKVTNEGVNWMIKVLKELKEYSDYIVEAVTSISVSSAIAESPLLKGQPVGLEMHNGLLVATTKTSSGARGVAYSNVQAEEDVGIKDIQGIVDLKAGKVTILKVPNTQRGGSRLVDMERVKTFLKERQIVCAIGIEALVALKKSGVTMIHFFGVREAVAESAQHGVSPLVACVEDEISGLIKKLEEENIVYDLVDIKTGRVQSKE
jgi:putative transcriptional regulator